MGDLRKMRIKNDFFRSAMDLVREVLRCNNIKMRRGHVDFIADKINQAALESSFLAMVEKLMVLLNVDMRIEDEIFKNFVSDLEKIESVDLMGLFREYPYVIALVLTRKKDEYAMGVEKIRAYVSDVVKDRGVAIPQVESDIGLQFICLSPLSHGSDIKMGNATMFRRMQVLSTNGNVLQLPFYAGNAIRGQLRDLLAAHFLNKILPANKRCALWLFHMLFAGGALEENSVQARAMSERLGRNGLVSIGGTEEFRNMVPMLSLLGTAIGNRVLSGRINVSDCRPRCVEWSSGELGLNELFEWQFMTRREDDDSHQAGANSSMIVNLECLKTGTVLDGGIDLSSHIFDMEKACLYCGLSLLKKNGYIGANNRMGFGKVLMEYEEQKTDCVYDDFLNDSHKLIYEYLNDVGGIVDASNSVDS